MWFVKQAFDLSHQAMAQVAIDKVPIQRGL